MKIRCFNKRNYHPRLGNLWSTLKKTRLQGGIQWGGEEEEELLVGGGMVLLLLLLLAVAEEVVLMVEVEAWKEEEPKKIAWDLSSNRIHDPNSP
jgi:hypothetical protein